MTATRDARSRDNGFGLGFLLPALIVYCAFVVLPFGLTLYYSLFSGSNQSNANFVGASNYLNLFGDPVFWASLGHNLLWAALSLTIPVTFGLFLAVLLSQSRLYGRTAFRALLFLPQVLAPVIVATVWQWMYNPEFGPVNLVLRSLGLGTIARGWLGDHVWALPALSFGYSWAYYGFCMVIFIAALQAVDPQLYEAARMDGASRRQEFRHITLPSIRGALATVMLFTLIESFKVFDLVFVGTRGGPGYSTWVLSFYLYDYTFNQGKIGAGLASAVVQMVVVVALFTIFMIYRTRARNSV